MALLPPAVCRGPWHRQAVRFLGGMLVAVKTGAKAANTMLSLDTTSVMGLLADLKRTMTPSEYNTLLYRVLNRTGSQVRTLAAKEVTKDYAIPYGKVLSAISPPMPDGYAAGMAAGNGHAGTTGENAGE